VAVQTEQHIRMLTNYEAPKQPNLSNNKSVRYFQTALVREFIKTPLPTALLRNHAQEN